jgi:uncharacterized protein (TIGR03437 family)
MANAPLVLSAASPSVPALAPGSLAVANGQDLAAGYPGPIFGVLPTAFDGTSVSITDSAGNTTIALLLYVAPNEVDFEIPSTVATGAAKVTITSNGSSQTAANVQIAAEAPALFTLNNSGLAAAYAVLVSGGAQTVEQIYAQNNAGLITPAPINLGSAGDEAYLTLYGTGFNSATASNVTVTVNGVNAAVLYGRIRGSTGTGPGERSASTALAGIASTAVQVSIQ